MKELNIKLLRSLSDRAILLICSRIGRGSTLEKELSDYQRLGENVWAYKTQGD